MTTPINPFTDVPCRACGVTALRLEWRDETTFTPRPRGTYSLAGVQDKVSAVATVVPWPWCVCDGCGTESKGKRG